MRSNLGNLIKQASGIVGDDELVLKARRGDPIAFNELINRHSDLMTKKVSAYSAAPVPGSAIYAHAIKLMKVAVEKYTPGSAANFRTYLETNLRGLSRFVNDHKSIARIPEHRSLLVGRYQAAKQVLLADKGREPTPEEIAHEMRISITDAVKLEQITKSKALSASSMTYDQVGHVENRFTNAGEFMYFGLTPQEQLVYDYSLGAHGKPALTSVPEIAKRVGISVDQVYRIKRELGEKIAKTR